MSNASDNVVSTHGQDRNARKQDHLAVKEAGKTESSVKYCFMKVAAMIKITVWPEHHKN